MIASDNFGLRMLPLSFLSISRKFRQTACCLANIVVAEHPQHPVALVCSQNCQPYNAKSETTLEPLDIPQPWRLREGPL